MVNVRCSGSNNDGSALSGVIVRVLSFDWSWSIKNWPEIRSQWQGVVEVDDVFVRCALSTSCRSSGVPTCNAGNSAMLAHLLLSSFVHFFFLVTELVLV